MSQLKTYIDRLQITHDLIAAGETGEPAEFADRLGISKSRLYNWINQVQELGPTIIYDYKNRTYRYPQPFDLREIIFVRKE